MRSSAPSRPLGTSRSFASGYAKPGFPKAPINFEVVFPPGDFTVSGLVQDMNSLNSPDLNISIANSVVVHSL